MFTRKVGPIWSPEGEGAAGAGTGTGETGTQNAGGNGGTDGSGSNQGAAGDPFAVLDEGTRGWLQTKGIADVNTLANSAREGEKLLGNAIRIPGKDATPEEIDAYQQKLGRPAKADDYQFTVPKDMPEGLPYDGERAAAFKKEAFALGLNPAQAAKLHDTFIAQQVEAFNGMSSAQAEQVQQKAAQATENLVKEWGPLDGEKFRANAEIADKVLTMTPGGQDVLNELKGMGLVGANKEILNVPLAKFLASLGTALYTEDGVLRGKVDVIGNPFDKNGSNFNLTEAMRIAKEDPDRARSHIAAAGGNLSEWGLRQTS